jgi:hypothetical protein
VGTRYLPLVDCCAVYRSPQLGFMRSQGELDRISPYSAMALNLIAGHRAVNGTFNVPGNFGIYMNDLPAENRVTLVDAATQSPLAGASVTVYRSVARNVDFYSKEFDDVPDPEQPLTADSQGRVFLGRNPFADVPLNGWHDSTVMLLRIEHAGRVRYHFMDASQFNMEFWRGHEELGEYELRVEFLP